MSKKLRITLFKFIDILVIFTMVSASPMSMVSAATAQDASAALATDKADYAPGESAHVTGSGFAAGEYVLAAQGPDGQADWGTVSADATGGFESDSPSLGSEGNYELRAFASGWNGDWEETPVSSANFTVTAPPEPTATPTEEPTAEPTATDTPTEEPTQEPTNTPTEEPTVEPSNTPTEEPTAEPTNTPTEEPTVEPTSEPTNTPTEEPTQAPTDVPTDTPTTEPTATQAPTDTPTSEPTATPTSEPTSTPTPNGPPTIVSDKADYIAGERVTLTGENWQGDTEVRIIVNDDIGQAWRRDVTVTVAADGTIYDSFNLPTFFIATYNVTARGLQTDRVATTSFTDAPPDLQNLWQCDPPSVFNPSTYTCVSSGSTGWVTGNNDGPFKEGETVPYRTRMQNLVASNQYSVTIEWDTTKSSKHALDYLKSFNATITAANPCVSLSGLPAGLCSGSPSTFPIPADTFMQSDANWVANGGAQDPGVFTMYGGTITGVSAYTTPGSYTGDTSTSITVFFTANSTNTVLAWGGHIASRDDWGLGNSAVAISGSPYHMRILSWFDVTNNTSLNVGNTDRSLSAEAVIFPASITIIKDAVPNDPQDFSFSTTGGLSPSSFSLDDDADGTLSNTRTYSGITNFTTYTFTEAEVSGWALSFGTPVCTVTSANGGTQSGNAGTRTLTVNLAEGENVTCTFTNELTAAPALSINKTVTDVDGSGPTGSVDEAGDVISYQIVVTNTGNVTLTGVTVSDPLLGTLTCTWPGTPGTLGVGQSVTCTGSYTATQGDVDNNGGGDGDIDNTATADSDQTGPSSDSEVVPVVQNPTLTINKTVTDVDGGGPTGSVNEAGDVISYSILVTNDGNQTLTGLSVSDPLLGTLICTPTQPATLAPGASMTCTGSYTASQSDIEDNGGGDGDIDNTATADSDQTGPSDDSEAVPVVQAAAISVEKSSTTATITTPGQVVPYTFVVTNTGNVTLTGITVTDPNCDAAPVYVSGDTNTDNKLQVSETWIYTCSHTVTQAEIDSNGGGDGDLDNTVTADSNESGPDTDDYFIPIGQNAAINVEKSSTTATITTAGQVVPYTFVVTNVGNVTLTGITVTDPNCDAAPVFVSGDTDNDNKLDLSESWTYTCSHTVTQAEIDSNGDGDGDLDNTVTTDSNESGPDTDDYFIPISQNAAINVEKSSTTATIATAGQVVPYTFVVTNVGNVTLTGITVTDPNCDPAPAYQSGDTNNDNKLDLTETWTYTCSHTVTQAEIDSNGDGDGDLDNTVTADSNESEPDTDDYFIPISQNAAINVEKSSTTTSITTAGQVVPYTFIVTNVGNVTLTGITVTDPNCDAAPVFMSGDTNNDGKLDLTESWTYTCNHTVTQGEIDSNGGGDGDLDNTVTADSAESAPDTDDYFIPISQNATINVEKSSTTSTITAAGQVVPYTFMVTNTGNVTLTGITVTDPNCDAAPVYQSGDTNNDGKLDLTETWTYTCSHTVTQTEIDSNGGGDGDLDNTVTADSNESGPDTDDYFILIGQNPALTINKTVTDVDGGGPTGSVDEAGDVISYSILVTNTGNQTLTGVTVSDPLLSNLDCDPITAGLQTTGFTIPVGGSLTCTGTYTATQGDIDDNGGGDGDIDNTATADSDQTGPSTDSEAVPVVQAPSLSIVKSVTDVDGGGPGGSIDAAGDVISYSILVTNTGNQTLTGVSLSDPLLGTLVCTPTQPATLAPGTSMTCTGNYTATQNDIDDNGGGDGDIDNTATADSDQTDPSSDSQAVPVVQAPAIQVVKSSTTTTIITAGQVVPYTFVVTNIGNMTLTGITVSDPNCDAAPLFVSGDTDLDNQLDLTETWTYTCSHIVTQAEIDSNGGGDGDLDNTVTADSNESGPDSDDYLIPISQNPTLTIVKSVTDVDGGGPTGSVDEAGDVISYSILVTNTGNQTLTGVTISDPLLGTLSCIWLVTPGTLLPGESVTCTGTYTATQGDIDDNGGGDGDIDNTATADSDQTGSSSDSEAVPVVQAPSLAITKVVTDVDGGGPDGSVNEAGDVITYSIIATNTGNQTLTNVTMSDPLLGALACTPTQPATLAPGASITCTGSYTALQSDIDTNGGGDGDIDNTATADSDQTGEQTDSEDVPVVQAPSLAINKTVTDVDGEGPTGSVNEAGDIISYSVVVTNTGNQTLTNVTVSDPLLGTLSCTPTQPATLAPGASMTCTGSYMATQSDIDDNGGGDGDIDNTATADSDQTGEEIDSAEVPVVQAPSLTIDKIVTDVDGEGPDGSVNEAGDVITYSIVVTNTGNQTLTGVSVTDPLLGALNCTWPGTPGTLGVDQSVTCTGSYTATQSDIDDNGGGDSDIDNTATADSNQTNEETDSAEVPIIQAPSLSITKAVTDVDGGGPTGSVDGAGDVISYSIVVTNTGNQTLTNVTVTDSLLSSLSCTPTQPAILAPTASMTCTGSYMATQADIDNDGGGDGDIDNTATADSDQTGPSSASEEVPIVQAPSLSIVKTVTDVDGEGPDGSVNEAGDIITYSIVVTNTGNQTLTGVSVSDPLLSDLDCDANTPALQTSGFTIPVGGSITCTGSYTATQGDIDDNGSGDGDIDNTATADSDQTDEEADSAEVPIIRAPSMTIDKTVTDVDGDGPTGSVDEAGDVITYSIVVTNTGNVTLTNITVSDPLLGVLSCTPSQPATLAPGETMTCTGSYMALQSDIDTNGGGDGNIDNTATADSDQTDEVTDSAEVPIIQAPSLTIDKTITDVDGGGPTGSVDEAGDVISYQIVVTNTGNQTLTGVSVNDPLLTNLDCDQITAGLQTTGFTIPVGGSLTCVGTYTTTQGDIDTNGGGDGDIDNTATADSEQTGPSSDSEDVPVVRTPALKIEKTGTFDAGTNGYADPGELITYTFVVTNTGNVTLTNVTVTDSLPGMSAITCDANTIPVGGFITCTATYAVTQDDIDAGSVYNLATADSDESGPDDDDNTEPLPQNPALMIEKTGTFDAGVNGYADPGELITYTFVVTNTGNVTLTNVTVTDPLPGMSAITCDANTIAVGGFITCSATYAVTQADIDAGSVYNLATADSDESGPDDDDNTEELPQNPALTIEKTGTFDAGANGYADPGELITYTFVVTNTGNVTLHNVTATDPLPGLSTVTCDGTTIPVGGFITCTATYAVTQDDIDAGSVYNLATADSDESGPDDDDNEEPLPQNPALSLEKTGTFDAGADGYADPGEIIAYTFVVTNTGNVTLTNVSVTDPLPGLSTITCDANTILVGGFITCTATYAVTQDDIDAGSVHNLATADSDESEPDEDDNEEPLPQNAALSLVKTGTFDAGANGYADPGELITYIFVVTNTGNVTLHNVTVSDPLPGLSSITCDGTTIPVGGFITCTAMYAVTQTDIDAGSVHNLATADSDESEPDDDDNTEELPQNPALMLEKTGTFDAGTNGYADPGELITYTFVVTNTGNVTLTNVTVTDPLPGLSAITCDANTIPVGGFITCTATYAVTQNDIDAGSVYNLATADSDESEPDDDDNAEPLPQNPALTIEKTGTFDAGANGFADPGELITYTFVVTNTGNVTLTNVTVTDPLPGLSMITCDGTTIPVGGFITCTATYAVTQDDIDAGSVHNLATADSDESEEDTDDNEEPLPQNPKLNLQKTGTFDAGANGYADPGELITYTFVVTNTGNVTLHNVSISDPNVPTITCPSGNPIPSLAVGASETCTGTYSVTQDDVDAGSVYNLATADSDESEPDDDDQTVTFPPRLIIIKQVINNNGGTKVATDFSFQVNGGDAIPFQQDGGDPLQGRNTITVTAGSYSITEPAVNGYATSYSTDCSGTIANGETKTCTVTNNDISPTLTVIKILLPNSDTGKFNLQIDGVTKAADVGNNGTTGPVAVNAGVVHTVGETAGTGTSLSDYVTTIGGDCAADGTVSLALAENKTCTITNVRRGSIVIVKNALGGDGTFDFTSSTLGNFDLTTSSGTDSTTFSGLDPANTYDVDETVPAGWELNSATCDSGETIDSIDLEPGETVTCTFENEKAGSIVIVKNTVGGEGTFDFTSSTLGNFSLITSSNTASQTFSNLDVDPTYDVAETVPTGWDLTSATCDKGETIGSIDLEPGETVTCTFTNTKRGHIIVDKVTLPSGATQSFSFTTTGTGYNAFNLTDAAAPNDQTLVPGNYTVTEGTVAGWDLTGLSCTDPSGGTTFSLSDRKATISLAAGETVNCTFTNRKRGTITIVKDAVPNDTADFSFTSNIPGAASFLLDDDPGSSSPTNSKTVTNLVPGSYSATEGTLAGWDLTSITCNDTNSTGSPATRAANIVLDPGETVTCTFTNTKRGTIIVEKQTNPNGAPGTFTFTGTAAGTIADNGTIVVSNLVPGTYTSTEADPSPILFALTSIVCNDGSSANPSTGNLATRTATFKLDPGETVRCVFTNSKDFHPGTIGFWKNWRNHYTNAQIQSLINYLKTNNPKVYNKDLSNNTADDLTIAKLDAIFNVGTSTPRDQMILAQLTAIKLNLAITQLDGTGGLVQKNDDLCTAGVVNVSSISGATAFFGTSTPTVQQIVVTVENRWTGTLTTNRSNWRFNFANNAQRDMIINVLTGINEGTLVMSSGCP